MQAPTTAERRMSPSIRIRAARRRVRHRTSPSARIDRALRGVAAAILVAVGAAYRPVQRQDALAAGAGGRTGSLAR
jgi:hypothetical protein